VTSRGTSDEGAVVPGPPSASTARGGWREHALYFLRYSVVGIANTAIYWGIYLLLSPFLPYFAAHLIAFTLALVVSFFLNCRWTFRVRPTLQKLLYFPLTNIPNFVTTSFGVVLLIEWLHVPVRLAPLIAAGIAVPFTFALSRTVLLGWTRQLPSAPGTLQDSPIEQNRHTA